MLKETTLKAKEAAVSGVQEKFAAAQSLVFVDYRGLTVAEDTTLRNTLRAAGVEYKVIKNTVIKRAVCNLGLMGVDPMLAGPTAVAFSAKDPAIPAKLLTEFIRTIKKTAIKGGVLGGKAINEEAVKSLADMPSKEQMVAKLLGTMNAPVTGLVVALSGIMGNFVRVLDAIREKKSA